jgi:hypothetical protein
MFTDWGAKFDKYKEGEVPTVSKLENPGCGIVICAVQNETRIVMRKRLEEHNKN